MHLVFIDEFGCTKKYKKGALDDRGYHPTRGYGGIIIPFDTFNAFTEDFAVLKIMALRQFNQILKESTKSIKKINLVMPEIMDPKKFPEIARNIIRTHHKSDIVRSSIVRAEIKSTDLLRNDNSLISRRHRFINLFLKCIEEHGGSVFYSGYEKKTISLSPKHSDDNSISLKEIEHISHILRRYAIKRNVSLKLLFDQHSIDEKKESPLIRKRHFDKIIQENNYGRRFPETVTIDVNSRYSLGMQAADWSCGLTARYLSAEVEPELRGYYRRFFPLKIRNLWTQILSTESILRHGRGQKFSESLIKSAAQLELDLNH